MKKLMLATMLVLGAAGLSGCGEQNVVDNVSSDYVVNETDRLHGDLSSNEVALANATDRGNAADAGHGSDLVTTEQ